MLIRPLEAQDVRHIHTRKGQFLGAHRSRIEIEEEVLKNVLAQYLVAEEETVFLGYVGYWLHEDTSEIVTLYVNEEHRQKGIGKALMEAVFKELKRTNITTLTLEVSEHNDAALRLYQQCGFTIVAKRKQYYKDGSDAWLMLKELSDDHISV